MGKKKKNHEKWNHVCNYTKEKEVQKENTIFCGPTKAANVPKFQYVLEPWRNVQSYGGTRGSLFI